MKYHTITLRFDSQICWEPIEIEIHGAQPELICQALREGNVKITLRTREQVDVTKEF